MIGPEPTPDSVGSPPGGHPRSDPSHPDASLQAPRWKQLLAVVSLALSLLLWIQGLVSSLERPSVLDSLALRQRELTALAHVGTPEALRASLIGLDPRGDLAEELRRQVESSETPVPVVRRLELILLDDPGAEAQARLRSLVPTVEISRRPLLEALIANRSQDSGTLRQLLSPWAAPLMVDQLSCERLSPDPSTCPAQTSAARLTVQLFAVNALPLILLLIGVVLLLREAFRHWRGSASPAPELIGPPLGLVDVVLLIAGGFVLLGEVLVPQLLQLPLQSLLELITPPGALREGLQVLILYLALMVVPLLILRIMLPSRGAPDGGWLQWRWSPLTGAFRQALGTVLMVLPAVALSGWLIERIWGDPGGSNPLLDLVLTSADPIALACFALTAIVLAPLFEETIFRGVLLPVVGRSLGGVVAVVVSAAVFAVAHLSLGELVPLFLLGIGLGWLRWRSGRLASSVIMHGLWNALTFTNLLLLAD